jgi:hypothetical protein
MNQRQKFVTIAAAVGFIYIGANAPWNIVIQIGQDVLKTTTVDAPLWNKPNGGQFEHISLDTASLYCQGVLVGIIYILAYAYGSDRKNSN